jgi:phospholipid/cholesterol/gamma-HCH transport system substrate-binding protein
MMERDAKYLLVGAFVLLVAGLAAFFVIWYTGGRDQREYQRYEIYFEGSVSGLSEGSVVRYLGVDVGRVRAIRLDPRAADRVQAIVDVDAKAPISGHTVASLGLQGVTGLLYIDLERSSDDLPLMPVVPSQRHPVIRSVRSDFDLLVSSMPELFSKAAIAADRISKLFSDGNIAAVNNLVGNISSASDELPGLLRGMRELAADLRGTAAQIEAAAAGVRQVTDSAGPDLARTMERVRTVAENLATASARLETFVAENQASIGRFSDQGLAELQQLIRDGRQAAAEFRELTRALKENPSQLIYEPRHTGVEIPR